MPRNVFFKMTIYFGEKNIWSQSTKIALVRGLLLGYFHIKSLFFFI